MTSEPIRAVKVKKCNPRQARENAQRTSQNWFWFRYQLTKFTDSYHKHNVEAIQHNYNTFTYLNPQTCKYKSFRLNNEKKQLQMEGNDNLTAVCTTDPLASQKYQFHEPAGHKFCLQTVKSSISSRREEKSRSSQVGPPYSSQSLGCC